MLSRIDLIKGLSVFGFILCSATASAAAYKYSPSFDVMLPGAGFDTDRMLEMKACTSGVWQEVSNPSGGFSFDNSVSIDQVLTEINAKADTSAS